MFDLCRKVSYFRGGKGGETGQERQEKLQLSQQRFQPAAARDNPNTGDVIVSLCCCLDSSLLLLLLWLSLCLLSLQYDKDGNGTIDFDE